jgi:hypothetical protein
MLTSTVKKAPMTEFSVEYVVDEIVCRVNQKRLNPVSVEEHTSINDKVSEWSGRYHKEKELCENSFFNGWELDSIPLLKDLDIKNDVGKALWPRNPRRKLKKDLERYFKQNKFGTDAVSLKRKADIIKIIREDLYIPLSIDLVILKNSLGSVLDDKDNIAVAVGEYQHKFYIHFDEEHQSFDRIFKVDAENNVEFVSSKRLIEIIDHSLLNFERYSLMIERNEILKDFEEQNLTDKCKVDLNASLTSGGDLLIGLYCTDSGYTLHICNLKEATGRVQWEKLPAGRYGGTFEAKGLKKSNNNRYYFKDQVLKPIK